MKKKIYERKKTHEDFWEDSLELSNEIKEKGPVSRHLQNILRNLVMKLNFKDVIEVGCGQGSRLNNIKKIYPKVSCSGVDISNNAIKGAKKNYPDFNFEILDIEKKSTSKKYDLVLCLDVVEHINNDLQAMINLKKMTKKYLVLSTIQGRMRKNEGPEGHVRNYKNGELVNKLRRAGFKIEKVIQWGFPFYSPIYRDILELNQKVEDSISSKQDRKESFIHRVMPFLMKYFAEILYQVMRLNSYSKGDYIFVVASTVN